MPFQTSKQGTSTQESADSLRTAIHGGLLLSRKYEALP
jgi:hypothetical protein